MGFETLATSEISASDYSEFLNSVRRAVVRPVGATMPPVPPTNLRIIK